MPKRFRQWFYRYTTDYIIPRFEELGDRYKAADYETKIRRVFSTAISTKNKRRKAAKLLKDQGHEV